MYGARVCESPGGRLTMRSFCTAELIVEVKTVGQRSQSLAQSKRVQFYSESYFSRKLCDAQCR